MGANTSGRAADAATASDRGIAAQIAAQSAEVHGVVDERRAVEDIGRVDPKLRMTGLQHVGVGRAVEEVLIEPGRQPAAVVHAALRHQHQIRDVDRGAERCLNILHQEAVPEIAEHLAPTQSKISRRDRAAGNAGDERDAVDERARAPRRADVSCVLPNSCSTPKAKALARVPPPEKLSPMAVSAVSWERGPAGAYLLSPGRRASAAFMGALRMPKPAQPA